MGDNILGILFEISADPAKAEAALARLKATTVAESGNISSAWTSAMSAVTGPSALALGGIVALGGGMLELANKSAEVGARIYEAGEKTGFAAEKLSGLMALSKLTGGSFDALTAALARAEGNLSKATAAGDTHANVLARVMGGYQNLAELGLKPADERIQVVLQRIFAMNDVGQRNEALNALLGRGWQQNIETLKMLAEQGYGPAIEKAKEFGLNFTGESAREAKEYVAEMANLKAELSGVALAIGQSLMPWMSSFLVMVTNGKFVVKDLWLELERWELVNEAVVTMGASLLTSWGSLSKISKELEQNSKDQTAAMTNQYLEIQKMVSGAKGAADAANLHAAAQSKAAKAVKEHSDAVKEIYPHLLTLDQELHNMAVSAWTKQVQDMAHGVQTLDLVLPKTISSMGVLATQIGQAPPIVNATTAAVAISENEFDRYFKRVAAGQSTVLAMIHTQGLLTTSVQEFSHVAVSAFDSFDQAMGRSVATSISSGENIGKAIEKAVKDTLASIAGEAVVRALYNTALGFYYLAIQDYVDADLAFQAAALFGAIGGVSGAAAAAMPGGSGAGAGAGSVTGGTMASAAVSGAAVASVPAVMAPGVAGAQAAALAAKVQQPTIVHMDTGGFGSTVGPGRSQVSAPAQVNEIHLHVEINAPVYGGRAGQDQLAKEIAVPIAKHLSAAVLERDVKLVASHSVNPSPVSRGRS